MTVETSLVRFYFSPPTAKRAVSRECAECIAQTIRRVGERGYFSELLATGAASNIYREICYKVSGSGGGLHDQSFRVRLDLNDKCILAVMKTD